MPNKYNVQAKRLALDDLIRKRAWDEFRDVFSRLSHPAPADEDGDATLRRAVAHCRNRHTAHRTLLHSLCDVPSDASPPPADVVRLVAGACPQSLALREPGSERTPLHLALARGAAAATVAALATAADAADRRRVGGLLALDARQQTPLLLALRAGAADDTVKCLVELDRDGASLLLPRCRQKGPRRGDVPLKYAALRDSVFVGEGLEDARDLLRFMIVRTYCAKLKQMFPSPHAKADNRSASDMDANTCPLQATILCYELFGSPKVASSILAYIIRRGLHHRDKLDSQTDFAGNLTLHIVCCSDTPAFDRVLKMGERDSDYGINAKDCSLMEYLLAATPDPLAAPHLSRNRAGDIPLHCAIRSGKELRELRLLLEACPSAARHGTAKGELPLHLAIKCGSPRAVVMELWRHFAEAAGMVDRSTGLYPFQLAAVVGRTPQQCRKGKRRGMSRRGEGIYPDGTQLDLPFFFLRECPSVLSTACPPAE